MKNITWAFLAVIVALPGHADIDELPDDTVWYMHADLKVMRDTESGSRLNAWFEGEIDGAYEEIGLNISTDVDSMTVYADAENGAVMIFEGRFSESTQDKMLAIAIEETQVDIREFNGREYVFIGDGPEPGPNTKLAIDDLEDASYSSFAIENKLIVTMSEDRLKALLDNGGKFPGAVSHDDAMFVLSAERSFVQAGARTDVMSNHDDDWQSNILRNTEQVALVIADKSGMIAIEALLVSADPQMAEGMASIVNGLLALQMFSSDIPPEFRDVLKNTDVDVDDKTLSIRIVVDPDVLVSIMDD